MRFVQFTIRNREHNKLFRFLNKHAPGWKLTLRPENGLYQEICERYELEDEEGFEQLPLFLRKFDWMTAKYAWGNMDHADTVATPVIYLTEEHAVIVKMFWPGDCQPYTMP